MYVLISVFILKVSPEDGRSFCFKVYDDLLCYGLTVHFRQSFEVLMHETEKTKRLTLKYNIAKVHGSRTESSSKHSCRNVFLVFKRHTWRKKRLTKRLFLPYTFVFVPVQHNSSLYPMDKSSLILIIVAYREALEYSIVDGINILFVNCTTVNYLSYL